MNIKSVLKGLDEAIKISSEKLNEQRQMECILPIESITYHEVLNTRKGLNLSQATFASIMGVSKKTVKEWEKGTIQPDGPAQRLIGILNSAPNVISKFVSID